MSDVYSATWCRRYPVHYLPPSFSSLSNGLSNGSTIESRIAIVANTRLTVLIHPDQHPWVDNVLLDTYNLELLNNISLGHSGVTCANHCEMYMYVYAYMLYVHVPCACIKEYNDCTTVLQRGGNVTLLDITQAASLAAYLSSCLPLSTLREVKHEGP